MAPRAGGPDQNNDDDVTGGTGTGTGTVVKARGIRWAVATRIVYAWIFTIPAAGLVGAATLWVAQHLGAW